MDDSLLVRSGLSLLALTLVITGCSSSDEGESADDELAVETSDDAETPADAAIYPGPQWDEADPAELGFDPATLDELAAQADAVDSNCLLVTRHGQIVEEWYWNDTTSTSSQEVFSATKSYSSTLVGIAQAEGLLDIDDKASEYIPEWVDTPSEDVTIRNLISNDSGRHWDFEGDYLALSGSQDRDAYAVGLSQDAPPGTVWVYNNAAIQTLDAVLQAATGQDTASYAQDKLFDPLGVTDSELQTDAAGNASTYFGLQSTCQDMARFGYLFLRGGDWDGTQVVPEEWVDQATQPSQEINTAYGFLWWLNQPGKTISPVQPVTAEQAAELPDRQGPPGADEDMYWAVGLGSQIIQVDPGSDTVVVRLGPGEVATPYGPNDTAQFVTQALTDP